MLLYHVPQTLSLNEVGDKVDAVRFLSVIAHLNDRGVAHLQRACFLQESLARGAPVRCARLQYADSDGVAKRPVNAAKHLAAQTSASERLADFVGRPKARPRRDVKRSSCLPPVVR